jgi:hypothetical protein
MKLIAKFWMWVGILIKWRWVCSVVLNVLCCRGALKACQLRQLSKSTTSLYLLNIYLKSASKSKAKKTFQASADFCTERFYPNLLLGQWFSTFKFKIRWIFSKLLVSRYSTTQSNHPHKIPSASCWSIWYLKQHRLKNTGFSEDPLKLPQPEASSITKSIFHLKQNLNHSISRLRISKVAFRCLN